MANSTYPKRLKLFKKWARAMEQGATVDNPDYSTARAQPKTSSKQRRKKQLPRRKRRRRSTARKPD